MQNEECFVQVDYNKISNKQNGADYCYLNVSLEAHIVKRYFI